MIWHILRKDVSVLWPIVLIAAAAHAASAILSIVLGPFQEPAELRALGYVLPHVSSLSLVALVGIVVHQESLLGTEQDWLIRPISRRDLLVEKLLFVLALGHGPLLVADLVECLGLGMNVGASMSAAASNAFLKFFILTVPAFCLATVTRNITEMLVAGVALVIACGVGMLTASVVMVEPPAISSGGLAWMRDLAMVYTFAALGASILPLQYFRRRTAASRALVIAGGLAFAGIWMFIPWAPSYALQQRIEHSTGSEAFTVSVADGVLTSQVPGPDSNTLGTALPPSLRNPVPSVEVPLSIRIGGASEGSVLLLDHAKLRLLESDGRVAFESVTRLFSSRGARIDSTGAGADGARLSVQTLSIPRAVYLKVQGKPLRLEIVYDITEMAQEPTVSLAAADGKLTNWQGRSCITRFDAADGDIDVRCLTAGKIPSCVTVVVVNNMTGERNPAFSQCRADYVLYPFRSSPLTPPLVKRFGAALPTYERSTNKALPVGPTAVPDASIQITTYSASGHYSRQLIVPEFRLGV